MYIAGGDDVDVMRYAGVSYHVVVCDVIADVLYRCV